MLKTKLASLKIIITTLSISVCLSLIAYLIFANYFAVNAFINKGKRFTATDGQELCLRIKHLETLYDKSLNIPCNYDNIDEVDKVEPMNK
jgi:hypothetical protein